jgi:murein L,D-transpeptidase YcbB/YkuD
MDQTRRAFASTLARIAALVPLAPALRPAAALADEGARADGAGDMALSMRRAAGSVPASDHRARAAVDRTLERLRTQDIDRTRGRLVLVNIAAAELVAYQDGTEVLRSRAIVGAARTPTPRLASPVPSVRLNPPWYVPASIEPEIRAAGAVGFRRANGRLVQPPGPRNPLGPVRIGLENSQGVFLHGTSEPRLFAREARTLSHGCVRVERVLELAAWMLDVSPEALRAAVATGRTVDLAPPEAVRVILAYLTAWPAADGRLVLHPDPYRLDATSRHRPAPRRPPGVPARSSPAQPAGQPDTPPGGPA